ncbi:hypothetical protein BDP27DRAFT_1372082 [Rhodocollybia butyracea]|uniref:Uncharacterized protein n=1 Tax=Rhodocollybia butyracea TaxID=206335 RepID=A0A9P5P8G6_9AGAR|nr:hypothetical protein BDP27DRAFT_1372082 [Rhodocollybia butyracea]
MPEAEMNPRASLCPFLEPHDPQILSALLGIVHAAILPVVAYRVIASAVFVAVILSSLEIIDQEVGIPNLDMMGKEGSNCKDSKDMATDDTKIATLKNLNITLTTLEAKLRQKIFRVITMYCVKMLMVLLLTYGAIMLVLVSIIGDMAYHDFRIDQGADKPPSGMGAIPRRSYQTCPQIYAHVSILIDEGITIVKSHIGDSVYLRPASNPPVMLDAKMWKPKIKLYSLAFDHGDVYLPLAQLACGHAAMYPVEFSVARGPSPGYSFIYGAGVLLLAFAAMLLINGRECRYYSGSLKLHMCGEIWKMMGMDPSLTKEAFEVRESEWEIQQIYEASL